MGEVHSLPKHAAVARPAAKRPTLVADAATRARIEEAAHHANDTAEHLIAILDGMDGNSDDEDGGDADPSLGALEGRDSQIVWLRGTDRDLEIEHHQEQDQ